MISVDEAKRLAKKNLSPKRYEHTCNVRKLAVKLAKAHGEILQIEHPGSAAAARIKTSDSGFAAIV